MTNHSLVSNPKKSIIVEFPLDRIRESVKNISLLDHKYELGQQDDVFNQYIFKASEFLSWGAVILINLSSISENKTEISIEVMRNYGAFDSSVEVQDANRHLINVVNYISRLTALSSQEIVEMRTRLQQAEAEREREKRKKSEERAERIEDMKVRFRRKNKTAAAVLALFLGFAGAHRIYLGQRTKGYISAFFFWTLIPSVIGIIDFFSFIFMSQAKFDARYNPENILK